MKSALITGASRGIGRGVALSLAHQGYALTISSRRDKDLVALARELRSAGSPRVVHHAADMSESAALPALVGLHAASYGSMRALVVNAGVGTAGPVADFKLERLHKTVQVNLTAAFVLIQASLPLLRAWADQGPHHCARVVALSSITGAYAEAGLAVYGATKAALLSLMETVNLEESGNGVGATAIAPAFVDTDMSAWAQDTIPAETMIRVDDIVSVVDMMLGLSRNASISRIVVARSGTTGYSA